MRLFLMAALLFFFSSCSRKIQSYRGEAAFHSIEGIPEYDKLEYWAAHPDKRDMSDTLTSVIKKGNEKGVDVFFVHPTTYTGSRLNDETNARIDDSVINYKTDHSPILYQSSVFNENNNIYAPRYRQAHISMYQEKDSVKQKMAFELAYQDVKKAFLYYLEESDKNQPFIIATHSQGTNHGERLIKELIDGTELKKRMVIAYLLGMPIKKKAFENIPPCEFDKQTGCFVSWRTFDEKFQGTWVSKYDTTIQVTNPLSWSNDTLRIEKNNAIGAVLYNLNKVYTKTHHAQIIGNALWINKPKFPGSFLYTNKNYHAGDINLFYMNIRTNVKERIAAFMNDKNQL